jgi:hypothetical protein
MSVGACEVSAATVRRRTGRDTHVSGSVWSVSSNSTSENRTWYACQWERVKCQQQQYVGEQDVQYERRMSGGGWSEVTPGILFPANATTTIRQTFGPTHPPVHWVSKAKSTGDCHDTKVTIRALFRRYAVRIWIPAFLTKYYLWFSLFSSSERRFTLKEIGNVRIT